MRPEAFEKAYDFTLKAEGGYSNNPNDYGGETYKGISRVYWPAWTGWETIDAAKTEPGFPNNLGDISSLDNEARDFYYKEFWCHRRLGLDSIAQGSQEIAAEVFDCAVNMGAKRAATFLQMSLNTLNRDERTYDDLKVDGWAGDTTHKAFRSAMVVGDENYLLKLLLILRGHFYIERTLEDSTQETFVRGWINRLVIDKIPD